MVEFLSKFLGRGIKIDRVISIFVGKSMIFFNILRAVALYVTSSWAIVFFALSLRLLLLVYTLWVVLVRPGGPVVLVTPGVQVVLLWHMRHGINLHATPKNSYNYYLLYEQPSPAKFTLSRLIHFYCCKRLLGRNNTATTSAPHERCQHLLKGALLLSTGWRTCDSSSASSYHLCWSLPVNWLALTKTYHHNIATVNSEFIFTT